MDENHMLHSQCSYMSHFESHVHHVFKDVFLLHPDKQAPHDAEGQGAYGPSLGLGLLWWLLPCSWSFCRALLVFCLVREYMHFLTTSPASIPLVRFWLLLFSFFRTSTLCIPVCQHMSNYASSHAIAPGTYIERFFLPQPDAFATTIHASFRTKGHADALFPPPLKPSIQIFSTL